MLDMQDLANKVKMHDIVSSMRRLLIGFLDGQSSMAPSGSRASELFSKQNPIDRLVLNATGEIAHTHLCMIEACSGSGKSLCAADFFVRNSEDCIYFLFTPSRKDIEQIMYSEVASISRLMELAMTADLRFLVQSAPSTSMIESLGVFAFDIKNSRHKWHILGALGYLWKETTTVAPVSVEEAKNWKRRWVLMDETIPLEQDSTGFARLVLVRRVLTCAGIHCIMLGTNSLVMNMNRISGISKHSRDEDPMMMCLTHRSLPRYLLSSNQDKEVMTRVFREAQLDGLLDNVNPWLCSLFLKYLKKEGDTVPCSLMRTVSSKVLEEVKRIKRNLMDESIYCMFQIAAHSPVSQLHISKGFAQLNVWQGNPPQRGSSESMLVLTREQGEEELRIKGTRIPELTSCFPSALRDPITVAVCAGGGLPFSQRSALEVLQGIHKQEAVWNDPIKVDAYERDANVLESFGSVVLMISSWSPPQELLKNIAFHCGFQNGQQSVDEILASVPNKESFVKLLKSCLCNLVPVLWCEQKSAASPIMGFYIRNRDREGRDGIFSGPTRTSDRPLTGGVECKNWLLSHEQLSEVLLNLLREDLDVYVCMVSGLSKNISERGVQECIKGAARNCSTTDWLVLHLEREGWSTSLCRTHASENQTVSQNGNGSHERSLGAENDPVKRKVLMIVEIGVDTQPFCGYAQ